MGYQRQVQNLRILRTILVQIGVVWFIYGCCFFHWERPWACTVAFLAAVANITLAASRSTPKGEVDAVFACHAGLTVSALGLSLLTLLTGVAASPFRWLLAALPAYAFCFLPLSQAILWTGISGTLMLSLGLIGSVAVITPEFTVGPLEYSSYQLLLLFLITLISAAVKSLSIRHVAAVKEAKFEAELASVARSRFTAHVSHEMRHPLQSIIGALELSNISDLSEEQRSLFLRAKQDADLLCSLVDSTLLFADLCQGRFISCPEQFTIEQLQRSVQARFGQKFLDRGVELTVLPAQAALLEGERIAIEHLLGAFLDNALKYCPRGEKVEVMMTYLDGELEVSVSDSGQGMSEEVIAQLHEPFRRGEDLPDRKERGFGLGIAIVHRLTEALGGGWGVESEPKHGSCFWFKVPCGSTAELPELGEHKTFRILVVDDDPICLKVTRRLLEKMGHTVTTSSKPSEAAKLAHTSTFDLVFMDCQMPIMDGFEATRQLRSSGFLNPVVALTANTSPTDREKCADSGMTGVVAKPATKGKLSRAIDDYLAS